MVLEEVITEKFDPFGYLDLDESEHEVLCHRIDTLDNCKYLTPFSIPAQHDSFKRAAQNGLPSLASKFTMLHHNVRSLAKNGEQFKDFLYNTGLSLSCILVTETWLNDSILPTSIPGFTLCHQNREGRIGGGVAIYLHSSLNFVRRDDLSCNSTIIESIFIEIERVDCKNIIVGCLYRPPEGSILQCNDEIEMLLDKLRTENKIIFLGGDLNVNILQYSIENGVTQFVDLFFTHSFFPTCSRPTRVSENSNTLIDCFFTNFLGPVTTGVIVETIISDHFPIILTCGLSGVLSTPCPEVLGRKISHETTEAFRCRLANIFINFTEIETADAAVEFFCTTIESEIDNFYPVSRKNRKTTPLRPWITDQLLQKINRKNYLYKEYLKHKTAANLWIFKQCRNHLKNAIRNAKRRYYQDLINKNKDNAKRSWQILKEVIGRSENKTCVIKQLHLNDGQITSDPGKVATALNDFFSSVGTVINQSVPVSATDPTSYIDTNVLGTCFLHPVNCDMMLAFLMEIKDSGGTANPISTKILKLMAPVVIGPHCHIVNLCFQAGYFPDRLKVSTITPIFKKGSKLDPGNYRPISVLSPLSKLIEKCIKERLLDFIENRNLLGINQFGFRTKHSTEHALLNFMDYVSDEMEKGKFVIGIYLDIKKGVRFCKL